MSLTFSEVMVFEIGKVLYRLVPVSPICSYVRVKGGVYMFFSNTCSALVDTLGFKVYCFLNFRLVEAENF